MSDISIVSPLNQFLTIYGPLGIGWIVAAILAFLYYLDKKKDTPIQIYKELADAYHDAILENTKVTERLAILIEERTRHVGNREN